MAAITDIELAAAMHLGDGVSTLTSPINTIVTRLNAVGTAYVQLYIPMAPDAVKNECIIRFASYLYDAPSASADGRFAAAWFNSGASALAAPFMSLSVSGTAELAAGPGQTGMGVDQAAVNALISAAVYAWAQAENADQIPVAKIPSLPASKIRDLPSNGSDSLSTALLNSLQTRVHNLEEFELNVTRTSIMVTATAVTVAGSRIPYLVGNHNWQANEHQLILISISNRPGNALVHLGTFELALDDIYLKPLIDTASVAQLSESNATKFELSDITFYIGRDASNRILFSADDIDTYTLSISSKEADLQTWARLTSSELIPATKVSGLPAAGLDRTAVLALVEDWAETGNATTVPVAKIPSLPASKITGLPTGGSGSLSAADRARLDDLTYTTTTTTPGSTIVSRTNVDVLFASDAYRVGTAKWPAESTATATITVWRRQGSVYTSQGTFDITLTAVYAKPAQSAADLGFGTLTLNNTGATSFTLNSLVFFIGRLDDGSIIFSSTSAFDFAVAISTGSVTTTTSVTDLQSWARVSSSDRIPATKVSGLPAAGLDRTAVLALVADWAETGNATTVPVSKIPSLPASKITGLPSSGGGGLTTSQVQALIADWAETGNAALIPLAKVTGLSDRLTELEDFEGSLTSETTLVATRNPNLTRNNQVVRLGTWPASSDATITVTWDWFSNPAIQTFPLSDIYDLTGLPADTPNLWAFSGPTDAIQLTTLGRTFSVGRSTTNELLVSVSIRSTYSITIESSQLDLQSWARVSSSDFIPRAKLAASYLNSVTARGQATVTSANDSAGAAVAFGAVNQVAAGDIVMISLDPATTSDGNATVVTRIPPSQEDVWFSGNEFQSESTVTDNVQIKLTNGTSYISMQMERGSHSTAPKWIRGNYTLYRINA